MAPDQTTGYANLDFGSDDMVRRKADYLCTMRGSAVTAAQIGSADGEPR